LYEQVVLNDLGVLGYGYIGKADPMYRIMHVEAGSFRPLAMSELD
jgi:hypothetical protein